MSDLTEKSWIFKSMFIIALLIRANQKETHSQVNSSMMKYHVAINNNDKDFSPIEIHLRYNAKNASCIIPFR